MVVMKMVTDQKANHSKHHYKYINLTVYIDGKDETKDKWELLSKAQSKKAKTRYEEEKRNEKARAEREEKERPQREKNIEEARKIIITEDTSLPTAKAHKIKALQNQHGERVKVFGSC
ncbi:unnamed protein product [Adineta steineri]|uniref:Asparagine--tRNA ligase N-terminal domain-containing protein n=1 Tax=Adineta steineri TaxID=433720 RepID=A0A815GC50_9BILA|nr:unnamed protein product [Adineta steineri]CAF1336672.1 unnamed protein product [Adineta steineri]CAF1440936.1 unnamed protein product [Adineta steineri]